MGGGGGKWQHKSIDCPPDLNLSNVIVPLEMGDGGFPMCWRREFSSAGFFSCDNCLYVRCKIWFLAFVVRVYANVVFCKSFVVGLAVFL